MRVRCSFRGQVWQSVSVLTDAVARARSKRHGFFVDLASHDAMALSNTLALERDYDWRGICIEPSHEALRGLAHRNCSVVVSAASIYVLRSQV